MGDAGAERGGAALARRLMRSCARAALATSFGGAPYVSLVLVAAAMDATPLLLLSNLAQHSRNVVFDPRVSLLFDGTAGHDDPLTGPRLSLIGYAAAVADPRLLGRFVRRHPTSAVYSGFADFRLYRVMPERGHLVAGFGRIEWIEGDGLRFGGEGSVLAAAEAALVAEMNKEHAEVTAALARRLSGHSGDGWRLTGLDPEGVDLRRGGEVARLDFVSPAASPEAARRSLFALAGAAGK
ncbi:MAG TPA: DUF2470 domain-containing protein [Stellaceae bacterium]